MGRGNIKQRNEIYAERSKTRKIAKLHQEMSLARGTMDDSVVDDDPELNTEQLKLDAKNVVMTIFLVLVIFAIP